MYKYIINLSIIVSLILLPSCKGTFDKSLKMRYLKNKSTYDLLVKFLSTNRKELANSVCIKDKNLHLIIDMNMIDNGCFSNFEDSLMNYREMKLFETIEYIGKEKWDFLLDRKTDTFNYIEMNLIYNPQNNLPEVYGNCKYKERLDAYWWYIECEGALN